MVKDGGSNDTGEASGGSGEPSPSPSTGADSDGADSGGLLSGIVDTVKQIAEGVKNLGSTIVDGLAGFFDKVVSAVKAVGSAVGDFSKAVGGWFKDLGSDLAGWFKDLGGWFKGVKDSILGLPQTIIDGINSLFQFLFVPADGFLNDKVSSLKITLAGRFHMETYDQMMNALKGYVSGKLNFKGYVDLSPWLGDHLDTVKDFLRAFFYPLILLGDFKFLLWVIRGSTIAGTSGGGGSD